VGLLDMNTKNSGNELKRKQREHIKVRRNFIKLCVEKSDRRNIPGEYKIIGNQSPTRYTECLVSNEINRIFVYLCTNICNL